ncbi:MAG: protein translocase subunit SecF [bacterium]
MRFDFDIDFLGWRKFAFILSGIIIMVGIVSLIVKGGPKYGIDFAGGTLVQIKFARPVTVTTLEQMRNALAKVGLGKNVQRLGEEKDEVVIRTISVDPSGLAGGIKGALGDKFGRYNILRIEMVGPSIGKDLRGIALYCIFLSLAALLLYITWRFEFKFAVGAVIALIHDTLVVIGIFSLLDKEFNIPIVAALLTIIGYSLNDTIVVFDRIRENLKLLRKEVYSTILNLSINQTLSRTIITALTTLFTVIALFIWGGEVIHDFAFAFVIGIIVGTYSSIYVASPIVLEWHLRQHK